MKKVTLLCALAAAVPAVQAADETGGVYFTPYAQRFFTDKTRNIEPNDYLYGLAIGTEVNKNLNIELNVNGAEVDGDKVTASDINFYAVTLDALTVFARDSNFSPFISLGGGVMRTDFSPGGDSEDIIATGGIGANIRLYDGPQGTSGFTLRPELKARLDDAGSDKFVDYYAGIGLQFNFGRDNVILASNEPSAPPAPPAEPMASNTTPLPAPEPQFAGPADADRDGVIDSQDQCPNTAPGVAIDAKGCVQKGSVTLEGVAFQTNSARLIGDSEQVLNRVAKQLKEHPRLRIELQGFTDSVGSNQRNLQLSQQRADAVRTYLLDQGVTASQVVARGYGETQPVADNTSAEGRAQNRRVVMYVASNPGDVDVKGEGQVQATAETR
jgi:OOP family OmpA-OmpF porin